MPPIYSLASDDSSQEVFELVTCYRSTSGTLGQNSKLPPPAPEYTNQQGMSSIFGSKHPSRDVIFSGQNFGQKMPKSISLHDVLEPLKQALLASRDVIISSQICGSNLQEVFTLGDGCWLRSICSALGKTYCDSFLHFAF